MNNLPTEILFNIFKLLPGTDIHICRRVCTRWLHIVDSLRESDWKRICKQDHGFIDKTYEKGTLSYKELDKSLALWPKITSASVVYSKIKGKCFRLLPNGILSVCVIDNSPCIRCKKPHGCWEHSERANTVVYYDVDSMQEIKRTTFQIFFLPDKYKENDKLIAICDYQRNIIVRTKTLILYDVLLSDHVVRAATSFHISDNKLFMVSRSTIHVLEFGELKVVKKRYALKTLWGNVIAVSGFQGNLYVLTSAYLKVGQIRCLRNGEFRTVATFDRFLPHIFEKFGFNWTDPDILEWLENTYKEGLENVTKFTIYAACRFGTTTLFVTALHKAKIFVSLSHLEGGSLHFTRATAIEYSSKFPKLKYYFIEAIDAVETDKGPTVFCMLNDRATVVAFEFRHKYNMDGSHNQSYSDSEASSGTFPDMEPEDQYPTDPESSNENSKDESPMELGSTTGLEIPEDQILIRNRPSTSLLTKWPEGLSEPESEPSTERLELNMPINTEYYV